MPRRKITLDHDTALEDGQFTKLMTFLEDKLAPDDLETVESIVRGGGDAPDKPAAPAADARPRPRANVPRVTYDAVTFPHADRLKA